MQLRKLGSKNERHSASNIFALNYRPAILEPGQGVRAALAA